MLLTADLHLTDRTEDEYRWRVFDEIEYELKRNKTPVYILGDLTDRKDRHSATLVNRLVDQLKRLSSFAPFVMIIMGNHDEPLNGPPFWTFLSGLNQIFFFSKPIADGNEYLLLPYSDNPKRDWSDRRLSDYKLVLMHQTVTGVVGDNGHVLENDKMPVLPRSGLTKIYSGDIHTPQVVRGVTYVGAPHPVRFGDSYPCRMLRLAKDYSIAEEIRLDPPRKWMANVSSFAELEQLGARKGDQARVRFHIKASRIEQWAAEQERIAIWAKESGITVASIETVVETKTTDGSPVEVSAGLEGDPRMLLQAFAASENLDPEILRVGLEMLT